MTEKERFKRVASKRVDKLLQGLGAYQNAQTSIIMNILKMMFRK